jgi:predicted amidohydrolase
VEAVKLLLVQPELSYDRDADNHGVVHRLVEPYAGTLAPGDAVLLPEHFDLRTSRAEYEDGVRGLAAKVGCHVVGGSHHEARHGGHVNSGVVADSTGRIVSTYEKLRPYAEERARVREGEAVGELSIGGHSVLVLVCADFWFSDLFYRASRPPELVLVPALSVTRKPSPDYSRALWRHLAIARAYEFGAYVGVSDWAHTTAPGGLSASGVSGFADPTTIDPDSLFRPIDGATTLYGLDFDALHALRGDRMARGFFWKKPGPQE